MVLIDLDHKVSESLVHTRLRQQGTALGVVASLFELMKNDQLAIHFYDDRGRLYSSYFRELSNDVFHLSYPTVKVGIRSKERLLLRTNLYDSVNLPNKDLFVILSTLWKHSLKGF